MGEPLNRTGRGLSPLGTELALLRTGLSPLGAGLALLGTESLPARGRALPAWERRVPARDGDSYRWGERHTRWFAACPFCPYAAVASSARRACSTDLRSAGPGASKATPIESRCRQRTSALARRH